jgi:lysophospholipid acyltransferase (LPLAT)-like uncharacterized protein
MVLASLGFAVVRGSSSRGGLAGARALLRHLHAGRDVAMALDGPKGPRQVAKGGAELLARRSAALLVPLRLKRARGFTLQSTWDKYFVPWPWSTVEIELGPPALTSEPNWQALLLAEENSDHI